MRVLLVDDDVDLNGAIKETLVDYGYEVDACFNVDQALQQLKNESYNIIVSDIKMPELTGYDFLEILKKNDIQVPVLLMTAYGTIEQAVNALKLGACDYITKPFDVDSLIGKIKMHHAKSSSGQGVIYESEASQKVFALAQKVAQTNASVLIQGESGTGKEVLARFIHAHSPRAEKAFIGINCAAIPENMLEATLFGYEKGAFTGAYQSTPGKFEQANHGTLLLDEISEMPLNLQAKLLRVLQENEVERLGAKHAIDLDVRIIATTNKDLSELIQKQAFREDLYFRLNVFPIEWMPLRARQADIIPLTEYFIEQYAPGTKLSEQAIDAIKQYPWPGNIRELQNVIQRAAILASDHIIDEAHLIFEKSSTVQDTDLNKSVSQTEFQTIQQVLTQTGGNRGKAAEILGISARTLRYKIAKMKKQGFTLE